MRTGFVGGEQPFSDPRPYLQITQPLNASGAGYAEIGMLCSNYERIRRATGGQTTKIFWGVGNGDSEMRMLMLEAEAKKRISTAAIDSQRFFLEQWWGSLVNLALNSEVLVEAICYNRFFEDIRKEDLPFGRRSHVVLGNTIGNYPNQAEIFGILSRCVRKDESLVLGVQLRTRRPEVILSAYMNRFYEQMVGLVKERIGSRGRIVWDYEKSDNSVRAYVEGIVAFYSKKYEIEEVIGLGKAAGFENALAVTDPTKNNALLVFRRCSA
ncbi:MAG: L-histidine N(alpha)-methyltransferase [Candidatus Micrarchaeota archaeon]|nr:L-histidine N(alpha)-methyltransferase [Candidatus Micrarchaeota archaeon]